jgi:hypothetical protein
MNIWLRGILSAAISGAATGIGTILIAPIELNKQNLLKIVSVVLLGALVGLANYLKQSPLPPKGE